LTIVLRNDLGGDKEVSDLTPAGRKRLPGGELSSRSWRRGPGFVSTEADITPRERERLAAGRETSHLRKEKIHPANPSEELLLDGRFSGIIGDERGKTHED
jgi:hypothetical protein